MLNQITTYIEGEGGVGKTSVLQKLLSYGWEVASELPTFFPCQPWSQILNGFNLHSQQHFLHMEAQRYSIVTKTSAHRLAFDRSFFSTLAYSHAIEQHWRKDVYRSTLSLLFDMLENRYLSMPNILVLIEAPLAVRQQRCTLRDSAMTPLLGDLDYSELHRSEVFAGALTHYYTMLPDRIGQLLPLIRINSAEVPAQEIAWKLHCMISEIECTPPEPTFASLFDALSNPSAWNRYAGHDNAGGIL